MSPACATASYTRFGSCLLIVSLAAAGVGGCTGMEATAQPPTIMLGFAEPARWIEPRDLPRYRCEVGSLVCSAAIGRLTTRLCRCVDAAADEHPASGSRYSSGANAP